MILRRSTNSNPKTVLLGLVILVIQVKNAVDALDAPDGRQSRIRSRVMVMHDVTIRQYPAFHEK